jgi:hypothetical protein
MVKHHGKIPTQIVQPFPKRGTFALDGIERLRSPFFAEEFWTSNILLVAKNGYPL